MCIVNITGGNLPQEEINAYIARGAELYGREPDSIDVRVDGDYVELAYHYQQQPFHRIRRITGYLVGTLDRFNNAKRAEERDRLKHSISMYQTKTTNRQEERPSCRFLFGDCIPKPLPEGYSLRLPSSLRAG